MAYFKEVGRVKELPYGVKQFEWSIPDYFTIAEDRQYAWYDSHAFSISDTSLHFRLYPDIDEYIDDSEYIHLTLFKNMTPGYLVEYNCGLKKCDGTMEQLLNGILKGDEVRNNETKFIKRSQLVQRKSELAPGNVLTVICTVKLITEMTLSSEKTTLDATRHLMLIRLERLSENFKDLLGDKETCDTTLKIKDREYMAHRTVLIARSSVFAATFKHDTLERQTGVITITDCDPESFQTFLEYIYCGKIEKLSFHSAINLYYTSNKYDVEELKVFCVEYLMQCLTVENVCEIAAFANKYSETQLFKMVQDFFNKHSLKIFLTSEWSSLLNNGSELANTLLTEMAKMKLKE